MEHLIISHINCGYNNIPGINDGDCPDYKQPTPKQRILSALYDIRDKELSEANVNAAKEIIEVEKIENEEAAHANIRNNISKKLSHQPRG